MEYEPRKHKIFGRPRASEEEKRSEKFSTFLTKAAAKEFREKCAELKISPSEFLQRAARGKRIEARIPVFDQKALEEIRAVGQNVNQTARELARARAEKIPVDFGKLETILQRQSEVLKRIKNEIVKEG